MIKRLSHFVDASRLGWESFAQSHGSHVIVVIPPEDYDSGVFHTTEIELRPRNTRPPISDEYRVGTIEKRVHGPPFGDLITIGRAKENDIVLRDIEVSKVHALFEKIGGQWTVRDYGSTNGTYINGEKIESNLQVPLKSSDVVKISPAVSAVFFSPDDFFQFLRSPEVVAAFK